MSLLIVKEYVLQGLVLLACAGMVFSQDDGGIIVEDDPFAVGEEDAEEELEGGRSYTLTFEVFSTSIGKAAHLKRSQKADEVIYETLIESIEKGEASLDKLMEVRSRVGHKASVEVIREYIYPTEFMGPEFARLPQTLPDDFKDFSQFITPALPTSFETRHLGDTVEVQLQEVPDEAEVMVGALVFTHAALNEVRKWGKEESEVAMPSFDVQRLKGSVRFESGKPLFVGSLADPTSADEKNVWMAFATVTFGDRLAK